MIESFQIVMASAIFMLSAITIFAVFQELSGDEND